MWLYAERDPKERFEMAQRPHCIWSERSQPYFIQLLRSQGTEQQQEALQADLVISTLADSNSRITLPLKYPPVRPETCGKLQYALFTPGVCCHRRRHVKPLLAEQRLLSFRHPLEL